MNKLLICNYFRSNVNLHYTIKKKNIYVLNKAILIDINYMFVMFLPMIQLQNCSCISKYMLFKSSHNPE